MISGTVAETVEVYKILFSSGENFISADELAKKYSTDAKGDLGDVINDVLKAFFHNVRQEDQSLLLCLLPLIRH